MSCIGRAFCVPVNTPDSQTRTCPHGHARQWCLIFSSCSFFGIILLVLNSQKKTLQSYPTRGVSTKDERFWSIEEVPKEIIPSSTGWAVFSISVVVLFLCVAGAAKRDLSLRSSLRGSKVTSLTKDIPFRGWGVGVYVLVNLLDYLVTVTLKYFNHQMRPKTLAMCYQLLAKEKIYNMTQYDGTLEQLRSCSRLDPTLFQGYPSGHSSVAFCGMFGCCLLLCRVEWMLEGFVHLFCGSCGCGCDEESAAEENSTTTTNQTEGKRSDSLHVEMTDEELYVPAPTGECGRKIGMMPNLIIRMFIGFSGVIGAALVASSRVVDGSHFPYQVNAGSMIGLVGVATMVSSPLLLKDVVLGGRLFSLRGGEEDEGVVRRNKKNGSRDDSSLNNNKKKKSVQLAERKKKRNTVV